MNPSRPRRLIRRGGASCLPLLWLLLAAALPALAEPPPPYPRLACLRPDLRLADATLLAGFDWLALHPEHLAQARTMLPESRLAAILDLARTRNLALPGAATATGAPAPAPAAWLLSRPGAFLAADVDNATASLPVTLLVHNGTARFRKDDLIAVDREIMRVTGLDGQRNRLLVERGQGPWRSGHAKGLRVAPLATVRADGRLEAAINLSGGCGDATMTQARGPESYLEFLERVFRPPAEAEFLVLEGLTNGVAPLLTMPGPRPGGDSSSPLATVLAARMEDVDADCTNAADQALDRLEQDWENAQTALVRLLAAKGRPLALHARPGPPRLVPESAGALLADPLAGFDPRREAFLAFWRGRVLEADPNQPRLQDWLGRTRQPSLTCWVALHDGGLAKPDWRRLRMEFASSLLLGSWFALAPAGEAGTGMVPDVAPLWLDEFDNGGRGRRWLGQPRGEARAVAFSRGGAPQVWRREFDNGTVLVNPSGRDWDVELEGMYQRIRGTQDPAVNTGQVHWRVRLPARDALLLSRVE